MVDEVMCLLCAYAKSQWNVVINYPPFVCLFVPVCARIGMIVVMHETLQS